MSLTFHYHPLSSFCHKALIALYENDTRFDRVVINFGDPGSLAAFKAIWPLARMPVLVDSDRQATVSEASIIIDYLDAFHSGAARLTPTAPEQAWPVRFWDRFFDNYVHVPMQKIVGDSLRPDGQRDPLGVEQAKTLIGQSYVHLENTLGEGWISGAAFSIADCSASPALFYANTVQPIPESQPKLRTYLRRLMARPSYARTLSEAAPFFHMYPLARKPSLTPPGV